MDPQRGANIRRIDPLNAGAQEQECVSTEVEAESDGYR